MTPDPQPLDPAQMREHAERSVDARTRVARPVRETLADTCRILAAEGHESGLAGQISARAGAPGRFLTLAFGWGFDEATAQRMVEIDDDLACTDGSGAIANPATRFHLWVYRHRPDVQAIVHTHPPHASALSMIGVPLKVSHMDATPFADNCAYLAHWPGLPVADDEGRIISAALGDKQTILLAHHGFLATGESVEQACFLAVFFERAARLQLLAQSAGTIGEIDPALALHARSFLLKPSIVGATFDYWARRLGRTAV